ncbi:MAG: hypothetical protein KGV50_04085 [Gammaproteobacteria bacterium]|nr:hypothetical protein [Gammaproteobacteria bacterium]
MKKKLITTILAVTLATSSYAANSISGSTDFQVNVPEVLVLYHWDEAKLTLTSTGSTPANDSDPYEISDTSTHDLSAALGGSPYTITGDVVTTGSAANPLGSSINVTLQNSWAVRSISSDDVHLAVSIQESELIHDGTDNTSKAVVSDAKVKSASISAGPTIDIPSKWDVTMGDIDFTLNLSGVTKSGWHKTTDTSNDSKDTFLLKLTGN